MKRKLAIILTALALAATAVACAEPSTRKETTKETATTTEDTKLGTKAMESISDGLYYDTYTGNVYWWNGSLGSFNNAVAPTPYYGPNGRQYKYNPETNELEEPSDANVQ